MAKFPLFVSEVFRIVCPIAGEVGICFSGVRFALSQFQLRD